MKIIYQDISIDALLHPLYRKYPGKASPQPAYIEINPEDQTIRASWSTELGKTIPGYVFANRSRRFHISYELTAMEIGNLMEEISPLAARLMVGYKKRWNGFNYVGCMDEDAQVACGAIYEICARAETKSGSIQEASVWLQKVTVSIPDGTSRIFTHAEDVIITSGTTDEEIYIHTLNLEMDSRGYNAVTLVNTKEYLETLRQEAKDYLSLDYSSLFHAENSLLFSLLIRRKQRYCK